MILDMNQIVPLLSPINLRPDLLYNYPVNITFGNIVCQTICHGAVHDSIH